MNNSYRPHLSFWQIWNMSIGFMGIQFGFALQNANTSRIFEELGAKPDELAILWLAAPVTGLLVQPIIGYYSDRTWHATWGRRRPYFMMGALLAMISLCLMPNSSTLWIAAGVLWIMDASFNISMEPFRAFVGDMLPEAQRTRGFAMQSFFIGTGAVIASSLPSILDSLGVTSSGEGIDASVKYSFYIGAAVLVIFVMWTVLTTKEYPPSDTINERIKEREQEEKGPTDAARLTYAGVSLLSVGSIACIIIYIQDLVKELYVLGAALIMFGIIHMIASTLIKTKKGNVAIVNMVSDFHDMPKTMKQLAFVQFFSWFALFCMWIYTTSAVTSHFYSTTNPKSEEYKAGANLVGNLFSMYNGVAMFAPFLLIMLARYAGKNATHFIALMLGGIGFISFYFVPDVNWLFASMAGVGIAWASILSIPYAILSSSLPPAKMGYYMGVFNFFIVIPQIIAAAVLGVILSSVFGNQSILIMVLAGVSFIVAALLTLRVKAE